jgi:hypothetical protein
MEEMILPNPFGLHMVRARVLGTIRQCEPAEGGWRGVMDDGVAVMVHGDGIPAKDYIWIMKKEDTETTWTRRVVGVYRLERKKKKARGRAVPGRLLGETNVHDLR